MSRDLTGARYAQAQHDADDRWRAVKETVNELQAGEPAVVVKVPGVGTYAVPKAVFEYLGAK